MGGLRKSEGMWSRGGTVAWRNFVIVWECPLRDLKERF